LTKNVTNLAASVRQRLANLARQRNEDFGLLLTKYALERLLFRISQSEYQKIFVLKGALLFELWTEQAHRPTRDADFLSNGDNDPSRFETIFKEICTLTVDEEPPLHRGCTSGARHGRHRAVPHAARDRSDDQGALEKVMASGKPLARLTKSTTATAVTSGRTF
jgi:hypothetical protein